MQLREKKGVPTPQNPFTVVTQVYRKEGIRAVYKGCGPLVIVSRDSLILSCIFKLFSRFIFFGIRGGKRKDDFGWTLEEALYGIVSTFGRAFIPTRNTGLRR